MQCLPNRVSRIKLLVAVLGLITLVIAGRFLTNLDGQHKQISASIKLKSNFSFENTESTKSTKSSWLEYKRNWDEEILIKTNPAVKEIVFTDEYHLKMISKGPHPLNVKHKYLHKRRSRLEKYCSAFPSVNQGRYNFGKGYYSVLFNDNVQLLQCMVQKVSSSTWVDVFIWLIREKIGKKRYALPASHPIWKKISLVHNCNDTRRMAQRYQTYTKFLITRNPFERLVSAYTSKFTQGQDWYEMTYAPDVIIANYLSNIKNVLVNEVREKLKRGESILNSELNENIIQQIKRLDAGVGNFKITFSEFLNYIIVQSTVFGRKSLDYHWAPITVICDPCTIRYDIIAKFETLHEDSKIILDYVQANTSQKVNFPKAEPNITGDRCNEAFRDIPLSVRNSLYRVYKEDFILFDYLYRGENSNKTYC